MKIWKQTQRHGSNMSQWNIEDSNGNPLGAIWTFRNTATERFPYTLKFLADDTARHFPNLMAAKNAAMLHSNI